MPLFIFILYEDVYERDQIIEQIKKSDVEGTEVIETYYRDDIDIYTVLDSALNLPLFATRKIVILKYHGAFLASDAELLLDYLGKASPATTFVAAAEKQKKKGSDHGDAAEAMQKLFGSLDRVTTSTLFKKQSKGVLIDMSGKRRGGDPLISWILEQFAGRELKITKDAALLLAEMCAKDKLMLSSEIEKLSSAKRGGEKITQDDVNAIAVENRIFDIYALIDSLCERKTTNAVMILRNLLGTDMPHTLILWHLEQFFSKAALTKHFIRNGENNADAAKKSGQRYYVEKFLKNIHSIDDDRLMTIPSLLFRADRMIKSGLPEKAVMEQLIVELL